MLKIKQDPKLLIINKNQPFYVPLEKVKIEATIHLFTPDVTITQVFRNNEETLIEAIYYFPIKNQENVYAFTARVDDREIVIESKQKPILSLRFIIVTYVQQLNRV
jgi:hypothetical protein